MPGRNAISRVVRLCASLIFFACVLINSNETRACSVFAKTVQAASNFDLIVRNHGTPIAGLTITVTPIGGESHTPVLEVKSDSEGRAAIRGLHPGEYAIDNLGPVHTGGLVVTVKSSSPSTLMKPLVFDWPWYSIAKARALRGTLRSADPQAPLAEINLNLLTMDSGSVLKTFQSGPSGFFDFGDMPSGLYVLEVHAKQPAAPTGSNVNGPIVLELASASGTAPDQFQLSLGETSCGVWYAQCSPQHPMRMASRRIRLTDPNGADISSAQYSLVDRSGHNVTAGRSDAEGLIHLPAELRGGFKLSIYSPGFTPLEQELDLVEPNLKAANLNVLMNLGGVCSLASLEKHATSQ